MGAAILNLHANSNNLGTDSAPVEHVGTAAVTPVEHELNMQNPVFDVLQNDNTEAGLAVDDVLERLGGTHSRDEILDVLQTLIAFGKSFNTLSDERYAAC